MRARLKAAACGLVLGLLAACAAPQSRQVVLDRGGLPPRAQVADVPFFPQDGYYCGPAALAMALAWSGLPATTADLIPQVYTPGREGTLRSDLKAGARRNGRLAVEVDGLSALLGEIAAGHPVIVFQNLSLSWAPQWHFAVAVGYDLEAREIVLHSGHEAERRTPLDTFEHTWARGDHWGLLVLPPDRLPASGDEVALVRAAAGLERTERAAEAALAYTAILGRWPDSFAARIGLGNARYTLGEPEAAERAFRAALARRPKAAAAWNNLAYALHAQGRRAAAVEAAERAVDFGGRNTARFRATLAEVSN